MLQLEYSLDYSSEYMGMIRTYWGSFSLFEVLYRADLHSYECHSENQFSCEKAQQKSPLVIKLHVVKCDTVSRRPLSHLFSFLQKQERLCHIYQMCDSSKGETSQNFVLFGSMFYNEHRSLTPLDWHRQWFLVLAQFHSENPERIWLGSFRFQRSIWDAHQFRLVHPFRWVESIEGISCHQYRIGWWMDGSIPSNRILSSWQRPNWQLVDRHCFCRIE